MRQMMRDNDNIYAESLDSSSAPEPVLDSLLTSLGGLEGRINKGDKALIKPNFVAPFPKATTDLAFISFFIDQIRKLGGTPVIGESSGFEFDTEATFDILGVRELAKAKDTELVNFEKDRYEEISLGDGVGPVAIAAAALEAKLIINLSVLKEHTITKVTGSVKNLFGLVSKPSRRRLHYRKLEKGIAALASHFDNAIHIVDARARLTRAVFGEEEPLNLCLAGLDPFLLDHYGATLLGIDPRSVGYLEGTGEYQVKGDPPASLPALSDRDSTKERVHRMIYSAFYLADDIKCSVVGGNSIIPSLHWSLGLHPEIRGASHEELNEIASLCPVDAVDTDSGKINKKRCVQVRCLKCHEQFRDKVILKGFNPPKGRKSNG